MLYCKQLEGTDCEYPRARSGSNLLPKIIHVILTSTRMSKRKFKKRTKNANKLHLNM